MLKNKLKTLNYFSILALSALLILPTNFNTSEAQNYRVSKNDEAIFTKLKQDQNLKTLALDMNKDVTTSDNIFFTSIDNRLKSLNANEIYVVKRLSREDNYATGKTVYNKKKELIIDKTERQLTIKVEKKYGKGANFYKLSDDQKNESSREILSDSELSDLMQKIQNPDLVSEDNLIQVSAATSFCEWDSNFSSSVQTQYGAPDPNVYPWNQAYWANDVRNGLSDVLCDYRIGIPQYSKRAFGINYNSQCAATKWSSLIAKSDRSQVVMGSVRVGQCGIWDANTLKNGMRFSPI
jgi:hypothetical protein